MIFGELVAPLAKPVIGSDRRSAFAMRIPLATRHKLQERRSRKPHCSELARLRHSRPSITAGHKLPTPFLQPPLMARITIDGRAFTCDGVRITQRGEVLIDDVRQEDSVQGRIEVHIVEGVLHNLEVAGDVHCGMIAGNVDAGKSVTCGAVGGNVDAGSSVICGAVGGNVDAGTSVTCGDVNGNVDAGTGVTINRQG